MAGKKLSPPKLSKPTCKMPKIIPDGRKIAISIQVIKTYPQNAKDQPAMVGKYLSPPKPSKATCTLP
jgi:hypothetical protein